MAQSLGYALSEEMVFDAEGRLRNPTFLDYKIMTAEDMPRLQTILVESEEPTGPFGAKSVGEVPMNATAPAVANAIYDAVGIRFRRLPITAERVFMALHAEGKGAWCGDGIRRARRGRRASTDLSAAPALRLCPRGCRRRRCGPRPHLISGR